MIYKVVPAAMVVSGSGSTLSEYFQDIINRYAKDGWRFYSMETATAEESAGCALAGIAPRRTNMNLLIFCKAEPGDEAAPAIATGATVSGITSKPQNTAGGNSGSTVATQKITEVVTPAAPMWQCRSCGTSNKAAYGMCKKCGTYRNSTP